MRLTLILLVAAVAASGFLAGCHGSDSAPAPTEAERQTSDRLGTIYKQSGGDWDKVSEADKKYLIDTVGHGSETTAKMVFGPKPSGGPPTPGVKRTGPPPGAGAGVGH